MRWLTLNVGRTFWYWLRYHEVQGKGFLSFAYLLLCLTDKFIYVVAASVTMIHCCWIPSSLSLSCDLKMSSSQASSRPSVPVWDCWGIQTCGLSIPGYLTFTVWRQLSLDYSDCIMQCNVINPPLNKYSFYLFCSSREPWLMHIFKYRKKTGDK